MEATEESKTFWDNLGEIQKKNPDPTFIVHTFNQIL